MFQSRNPVLNSTPFQHAHGDSRSAYDLSERVDRAPVVRADVATLSGTTIKTFALLAIVATTAMASFNYFVANPGAIMPMMFASLGLGLVGGFLMLRKPTLGWLLAPIFALGQGGFVAAISVMVTRMWMPGAGDAIIFEAIGLTFAIAAAMLALYGFRIVRLSNTAMKIISVMVGGVAIYYAGSFLVNSVMGMTGVDFRIPQLGWMGGTIGIVWTGAMILLASFMLIMDFQRVEDAVKAGAPKYVEWLGAFAIMTTLVWLYVEVLRLLAILRGGE